MRYLFRHLSQYLLDMTFPPRCGNCGGFIESAGKLCSDCWKRLCFISSPCCAACGYPFAYKLAEDDALCGACMHHKPHYDGHRSMLRFDEASKKLIHDLKFHDKPLLLPLFGSWLKQISTPWLQEDKLIIIPVPLHYLRLLKRRYNQSALLANSLAKQSNKLVLMRCLKRIKYRPPQAGLNRSQRLKNTKGVFTVNKKYLPAIKGSSILLIDDVMTTGATLNSCARALKRAGADKVYAVTLARTVLSDS